MNGLIARSRIKRSRKNKNVYAKKRDGLVEFFDFFESVKKNPHTVSGRKTVLRPSSFFLTMLQYPTRPSPETVSGLFAYTLICLRSFSTYCLEMYISVLWEVVGEKSLRVLFVRRLLIYNVLNLKVSPGPLSYFLMKGHDFISIAAINFCRNVSVWVMTIGFGLVLMC